VAPSSRSRALDAHSFSEHLGDAARSSTRAGAARYLDYRAGASRAPRSTSRSGSTGARSATALGREARPCSSSSRAARRAAVDARVHELARALSRPALQARREPTGATSSSPSSRDPARVDSIDFKGQYRAPSSTRARRRSLSARRRGLPDAWLEDPASRTRRRRARALLATA
jgi:hypothetical protein